MSTIPASPRQAPGRPRAFAPDTALRAAMDVFWLRGYETVSLDDLCAAMGVSRSSFYACFGSKHAVLIDALRLYADACFATLVALRGSARDPRDAVRAMLATIADVDGGTRGCFFVNSVAELARNDAELQALAQAHTARCGALLASTLGALGCSKPDADARAGALLAMAMGITTLRKTGVPPAQLAALLAQAQHLIPDSPSR